MSAPSHTFWRLVVAIIAMPFLALLLGAFMLYDWLAHLVRERD